MEMESGWRGVETGGRRGQASRGRPGVAGWKRVGKRNGVPEAG